MGLGPGKGGGDPGDDEVTAAAAAAAAPGGLGTGFSDAYARRTALVSSVSSTTAGGEEDTAMPKSELEPPRPVLRLRRGLMASAASGSTGDSVLLDMRR